MSTGRVHATIERCMTLNEEFKALTGRDAYHYTSEPTPGSVRMVFADGVQLSYSKGLLHMETLLAQAKAGTLAVYPYA